MEMAFCVHYVNEGFPMGNSQKYIQNNEVEDFVSDIWKYFNR